MTLFIGVTLSKPLNEYWIQDRFQAPEGLYLKNLAYIHPEIFGELDVGFPHAFLFSLESLEILSTQSLWIARDGFTLLKFFFQRFPEAPAGFSSKIYIQDQLKALVPKGWEGHFYSYVIRSTPSQSLKQIHLLFFPHLPNLKKARIPKVENAGLTFCNKSLGLAFHESEKDLVEVFTSLQVNVKSWKLFKLDHYAQYPNDSEASFINMNDEFLCSLPQSYMLYLNFNYRLLDDQTLDEAEELKINLNSSLHLARRPISSQAVNPNTILLKEFVDKAYVDQLLPYFPFTQNFVRASFEIWKIK